MRNFAGPIVIVYLLNPSTMSMVKGLLGTVAKQYQNIVRTRVANMGLKYEDLLIESDDVEKAINRIPTVVKIER